MAWMPEPVWIKLAGVEIEYSVLYVAFSFVFALLLMTRRALEESEDPEPYSDWVPYGIGGGLVGSRVGYFLFEIPLEFLAEPQVLLWRPGFSFHGACLGLLVATWLYARKSPISFARIMDRLSLPFAVAFLLTSLGSLMSNDVVGVLCKGPLSLRFPIYDEGNLLPPDRLAVFHLQVVAGVLLVAFVWGIERRFRGRSSPEGGLAALTLTLLFAVLLALDPFKVQRSHLAADFYPVMLSTLDGVGLLTAVFFLLLLGRRRVGQLGESSTRG